MNVGYDAQRVTTADNIGISFRVAGLATRVTAAVIDGMILAVLLTALFLGAGALAAAIARGGSSQAQVNVGFLALLLGALMVIVVIAYFTLFPVASAGRTPGKSAMGIRVMRVDGTGAGLGDNFLRSLALVVDVLGTGPLLMFFHPQSRRLGDLVAGTVVVRERTPVTLAAAATAQPLHLRSPEPGPPLDGLGRLGERDFQALRAFLSRPGLAPPQRAALAGLMAAPLLDRMDLPPHAPERAWPPELLLERLYLQLLSRLGSP